MVAQCRKSYPFGGFPILPPSRQGGEEIFHPSQRLLLLLERLSYGIAFQHRLGCEGGPSRRGGSNPTTPHGPCYRTARQDSINRSRAKDQFWGLREAVEAPHSAVNYPADQRVTGDGLTVLCAQCHVIAISLKRFVHALERSDFEFMALFRKTVT